MRIQAFSSTTNAGSFICAVLPNTTYSRIFSPAGRPVRRTARRPLPVPACSTRRSSSGDSGLPS
jgi:hypothetical protein